MMNHSGSTITFYKAFFFFFYFPGIMMINFLKGQPSEDILPTQLFAKAAQKAFSRPNAAVDVLQVHDQ